MGLSVSDDDGTVSVRRDGDLLARYDADGEGSKPGFDTVALPAEAAKPGENLTVAAPHDHPWHLGAFFCQKLVDGINCWESEPNAAAGEPHGFAESDEYGVEVGDGHGAEAGDDTVTIRQDATWRTDSGESLLGDSRTIRVHSPERSAGGGANATDSAASDHPGYLLTWEQEVTAVEQRRHLSSETLHGHYSGLSFRFARSLRAGRVLLPDGTDPGETSPPRAASGPEGRWCDYSGPLDGKRGTGDPWTAGVAMFDHPDNDHHPVNWFVMDEPFGFLAANPTWGTVLTLAEGESLTWRWGMWVHDGTPDESAVEAAYERYVGLDADGE